MLASSELPVAALERLVENTTGTAPPLVLEEILGGASTRRFFRVRLADQGSAIAMFAPIQSHELGKDSASARAWPYLEVRELLEARGVRVPRLLATACEHGLILIEDLGETLARHLSERPSDRERLYSAAVRDLARAQRELHALPEGCIIRQRAFDEELLFLEIEHFREWALEARGVSLSAEDRAVFDAAARDLAHTIATWPRGFVHRDYQSRNLMVVPDRGGALGLGWVDFQDALLGPRIYDMVALLNDSYQSFSPGFVEQRLDEFTLHLGLPESERKNIGREFRLVTVQRKLKDAGRFVYIDRKLGNPSFLGFVEPTIQKAQRALDDLVDDPKLGALAALLERLFPRPQS
jgi:hypothetical protein